jgi:hypothetical protein
MCVKNFTVHSLSAPRKRESCNSRRICSHNTWSHITKSRNWVMICTSVWLIHSNVRHRINLDSLMLVLKSNMLLTMIFVLKFWGVPNIFNFNLHGYHASLCQRLVTLPINDMKYVIRSYFLIYSNVKCVWFGCLS